RGDAAAPGTRVERQPAGPRMLNPRATEGPGSTIEPSFLVLVVEDDPANRALLERLLQRDGYRTQAVADGEAALLAVAEHSPDLILLDIGLPRLDGYEVTRRLRSH